MRIEVSGIKETTCDFCGKAKRCYIATLHGQEVALCVKDFEKQVSLTTKNGKEHHEPGT